MVKKRDLGKSRLFLYQEEKQEEMRLLKKIRDLPPEMIRLIYSYMSGKAKTVCNYKLEYIERSRIWINIMNWSKVDILQLIYKGVLRKYPIIIESIVDYFYNEEMREYTLYRGNQIIQLWENNKLVYTDSYGYVSNTNIAEIDQTIKFDIECSISSYIKDTIQIYKNSLYPNPGLLWNLEQVGFLCKCLEDLRQKKRKLL